MSIINNMPSVGSSEIQNINIGLDISLNDEELEQLPYRFYGGSAVVYNNEIHILGSEYDNNTRSYHYKYNGSTNKWTQVSRLPYYFDNGSAVVYNNEIHILGSSNSSNRTKHYKYNGSSWTSVSTLPYNFYYGSAVVYNNEIHILGGSYDSSSQTKHYKYNGSSWTNNIYCIYLCKDVFIMIADANNIHYLNQDSTEVISDTVLKTTKDCKFKYLSNDIAMTIYK